MVTVVLLGVLVLHVLGVLVLVMAVLAVAVVAGGRGLHESRRQQLHAALRAVVRGLAGHLRMHRAHVAGRGRLGDELHAARGQWSGVSLVTSGCIGHT